MRKKIDEKHVLKVNDKPIYDFLKSGGSLLVCSYADKFSGFNASKMIDDQQLGFLANFLGVFIFGLVIAYHYVMADPKYEGN
ncbi:hypothetical protein Goshw_005999 [Gossypium schwendimanii]|uniref:Dolichyl-diphosphooligosaccharide--protein glycosyltransferase subunit 4 n=6 Tax=Gossypium TaxID=3633 RepID=A0A7J9MFT2_GOSSC|nr:hypothetical protein [Gossypium schwendimanii]